MRNFYLKKKDVKVFMGSQEFSGDLARKMMVEMVIWRCQKESLKEWREAARWGNEKEGNEKKGAGQRDKGELKKELSVVGLGGAWHVGNQKSDLTFFYFFYFLNWRDVTRGVQAKPWWIRQKLLAISFLPRPSVLVIPPKCRWLWGGVVGFEKDLSASQCRRFLLWMHSMADGFFETNDFISSERV